MSHRAFEQRLLTVEERVEQRLKRHHLQRFEGRAADGAQSGSPRHRRRFAQQRGLADSGRTFDHHGAAVAAPGGVQLLADPLEPSVRPRNMRGAWREGVKGWGEHFSDRGAQGTGRKPACNVAHAPSSSHRPVPQSWPEWPGCDTGAEFGRADQGYRVPAAANAVPSSRRDVMFSFEKTLWRWYWTVRGLNEEPTADVGIRQALPGEPCDLKLLRSQLGAFLDAARSSLLASGASSRAARSANAAMSIPANIA